MWWAVGGVGSPSNHRFMVLGGKFEVTTGILNTYVHAVPSGVPMEPIQFCRRIPTPRIAESYAGGDFRGCLFPSRCRRGQGAWTGGGAGVEIRTLNFQILLPFI